MTEIAEAVTFKEQIPQYPISHKAIISVYAIYASNYKVPLATGFCTRCTFLSRLLQFVYRLIQKNFLFRLVFLAT